MKTDHRPKTTDDVRREMDDFLRDNPLPDISPIPSFAKTLDRLWKIGGTNA